MVLAKRVQDLQAPGVGLDDDRQVAEGEPLVRGRLEGDVPGAYLAQRHVRQVELNDLAVLIAEAERDPRPQNVGAHGRGQDDELPLLE